MGSLDSDSGAFVTLSIHLGCIFMDKYACDSVCKAKIPDDLSLKLGLPLWSRKDRL